MGLSATELKKLIDASYRGNNGAERSTRHTGFTLDRNLSDREQKVFTDPTGKPYIVFAGSRKTSDWLISNTALALGYEKMTPRFIKSNGVLEDVAKKYGRKITVAGHSLGGAIASSVGQSHKVDRIVSVDKGVGRGGLFKPQSKKETSIRGATDLVSLGSLTQFGGKHITLPQTAYANVVKSHDHSLLGKLKGRIV